MLAYLESLFAIKFLNTFCVVFTQTKNFSVSFSYQKNKRITMDIKNNPIWIKVRNNMINNINESNIPLQQLAKTTGMSIKSLRNFVNGKTNTVRTPVIIKLSKALNMTLDDFLGMKDL